MENLRTPAGDIEDEHLRDCGDSTERRQQFRRSDDDFV